MSKAEKVLALIANAQTKEDAVLAVSKSHPKLSKKEAERVIDDMTDCKEGRMGLSELNYRLKERGLYEDENKQSK